MMSTIPMRDHNAQLTNGQRNSLGQLIFGQNTNQQSTCNNYNSGSGSQTTGCSTTTYCCQDNNGKALINISCSPITIGG
ncbi:unnamed protein product [Adineta steineri]|uniref:Hydrophobin n=2 Tax=Adineta steineri TaxID=433720 RepID=A0A814XT54_9BILA|nr:unnamed protein product [Adineta steineri]